MISAVNSINNNQQYVNFEGKKNGKAVKKFGKKVGNFFEELLYTLGIKKKKTFWDKVVDFFTPSKKSSAKKLKKNSKEPMVDNQPQKDGLLTFMGKDLAGRVKKWDDVLFG